MHISDGLLPAKVCISGYGVAGLITWYSLRQINRQLDPRAGIPKAALLTAAFFAASSIQIPIPPASVHLVLNGALGAVLGCYAFPAILIGLLFQALVFGHGGLTTLGVNALIMGCPAFVAAYIFRGRHWVQGPGSSRAWATPVCSFLAGACGLGMTVLLFYGLVLTTLPAGVDAATEQMALNVLLIAHLPLMVIEGTFTALLVQFLQRVKPELVNPGQTP